MVSDDREVCNDYPVIFQVKGHSHVMDGERL